MDIHLRWKLLRQFFPEIRENRSPRAAEDLAYLTDGNSNTSESLKLPRDGWKKIDLDVLRKKFFRLFDAEARLKDHTWVVSELVRLSPNVSPDSIQVLP